MESSVLWNFVSWLLGGLLAGFAYNRGGYFGRS